MAVNTDLAVSNLTAFVGANAVWLSWQNDDDGCLTYLGRDVVEIWEADSNDRSTATKVDDSEGNNYQRQGFGSSGTRYYWIRAKNTSGEVGPWEPANSTGGVAATPLNYAGSNDQGGPADNVETGVVGDKADEVVFYQSFAPSHKEGRLWIDSSTGQVNRSVSGSWTQIGHNDALELNNGPAESGAIKFWSSLFDDGGKPENNATVGADWDATLANIPDRVTNTATTGLNVTDNFLGYYDGSSFTAFIDNSGKFTFKGTSGKSISWDGSTLLVEGGEIKGSTLTGNTVQTSSSDPKVILNGASNLLEVTDSSGNVIVEIGDAGFVSAPAVIRAQNDVQIEGELTCGGIYVGGNTTDVRIDSEYGYQISTTDAITKESGSLALAAGAFSSIICKQNTEVQGNVDVTGGGAFLIAGTAALRESSGGRLVLDGTNYTDATVTNDFEVQGALSKTSGSFRIRHPDPVKSDCDLVHSFVESPTTGDNLYRWRVHVPVACELSMPLPDYWPHLNCDPQVWVSPHRHLGRATGWVSDDLSTLHIQTDQPGEYDVLLIGTRADPDAVRAWPGVEPPRRTAA